MLRGRLGRGRMGDFTHRLVRCFVVGWLVGASGYQLLLADGIREIFLEILSMCCKTGIVFRRLPIHIYSI
jgi:hypothetical protein